VIPPGLDRAEDFFAFLEVPFDPRVVAVYRLRLLRRFGLEKAEIDRAHRNASEPELLRLYAQALRGAHDQFAGWLRTAAPPGDGQRSACSACATCG
jgi:nitrogenase-stabilizing/protective protein